jgi:hypothetical protein
MAISTVTDGRSPLYESKFLAHQVEWEYDADVPLDSMVLREGTQVRQLTDIAPSGQVSLYAVQMDAGEQFPAVILWQDIIIDGNTRIHAARKIERVALPAYRIKCRNERHARQVGAAINQTNGRRLALDEARTAAADMSMDGFSDAFIARELGLDATKVRRWRQVQDATDRADKLGLGDKAAAISSTNLAKLAQVTHDAPFQALVETVADYAVDNAQITELLSETREAASDEAAVSIILEAREQLASRSDRRASQLTLRVTAREANKSISSLVKHDASYWVDATVIEDQAPRWRELLALAQAVVAEYDRLAK